MARSSRSSSSSYNSGSNSHPIINFLSFCLALLVIVGGIAAVILVPQLYVIRDPICRVTHIKLLCQDAFNVQTVQVDQDTMYIGLSDGGFPFDAHDPDSNFKQQGASDYQAGHLDTAIQDWQQAIATTTDDAESMIYIENARIEAAHQRYVTIIVPTTLSEVIEDNSTSISVARDDLRGVYLAQKEFNAQNPDLKVRIVLANLGVKDQHYLQQAMPSVLNKITLLASIDSSVIGVVGFPFSASAATAIPVLANARIPMISPSASSTSLFSPYFFRVAPPDNEQGKDAAQFASQILGAHSALVLSDQTNSYSKSLGTSFATSFSTINGNKAVNPQSFTLHVSSSLDAPLHSILAQNSAPNLIFVAGYGDDVNNVKSWLAEHSISAQVMGGDASYELGSYQTENYSNFFFSAFTYPDTWSLLCPTSSGCASHEPAVFRDSNYQQTFDPNNQHIGEYSYSRPGPHALLSYDATKALLQAAVNALPDATDNTIPRTAIRDALQQVSFQGASGQVSFNASNPVNKSVVMLCVDHKHLTHLLRVYGSFTPGGSNFQNDPAVCA